MENSVALSQISHPTLAEVVMHRIRNAIISGQLAPGERLTESVLAKQLKVSRSPVRIALMHLEQQHLVKNLPNRSTCVWKPTEIDIEEIFTLRAMLECTATQLVIDRLTDKDLAKLESILNEHKQAVEDGKALEAIAADRQFHRYVCCLAGNFRLMRWWEEIISQWEVLLHWYYEHFSYDALNDAIQDHEAILDGLRRRDSDFVCSLHNVANLKVSKWLKQSMKV